MFYKNNKAFTIYELLAIFAILAINMLLTLPAIVDIVENSREKAFEIQMSNIKSAARIYMLKLDLDDNAIITIPLFVLQKEGLLEPNMKNPKTNEIYNDCMPIRIKKFDNFYTYQIETDLEEYSCNIDESVLMTLVGSYNDETVKDSQYVDEGIIVKNSSGEKIDESLIKVKITKTINGNSQILDDIYYDELSDQILTDDYYQYKLEYIYNDSSIIRFVNVVDYTSKILEFYKPTILISNGSDNSKNVVINDNQAGTYLIKSFKNITSNKDVTLCSNVDGAAFECNGSTTRNLSAGVWYKVVDLTTIFNFTEKGSIVVKVSDGYNYNTNSAIVSAGELVVTLDANGGTLSTNTLKVYNGEIYGTLPTPTREGYTFKGWNGKNKFDYEEILKNNSDVVTKSELNEKQTINWINGSNANSKKFLNGYFKENTQYVISGLVASSKSQWFVLSFIYLDGSKDWINYNHTTNYMNANEFININFVTPSNKTLSYIRGEYSNNERMYIDINSFQIEEGTTATPWEPYYITSDVTVTQTQNHTLKAIWEPNTYTVTLDANGGSIPATSEWTGSGASASKQVTYDLSLPNVSIPTKAGYAFKGYYSNTNAIDMQYGLQPFTYSGTSVHTKRIELKYASNNWSLTNAGDVGTHIQAKFVITDSTLTTAPSIDFDDVSITPKKVIHNNDQWILYVDFDISSYMISERSNVPYDTVYRFIDVNGTKETSTLSIEYIVKNGKKYYDSSGNGLINYDLIEDTTLYALWEEN